MPADNRYAFLVEWLDPQAQLVRQYLLFYYSIDATVEMVSAFPIHPSRARGSCSLSSGEGMRARHSGAAFAVALQGGRHPVVTGHVCRTTSRTDASSSDDASIQVSQIPRPMF
jgi:hypothetical protein